MRATENPIMAKAVTAPLHAALIRRTPDCGPLRLGMAQMAGCWLDPRWLLVEAHRLHRLALERAGGGPDGPAADGSLRISRFVIDGRLEHFRDGIVAIFEWLEPPSAATCWSGVTRLVAEGGAEVRVELGTQAALRHSRLPSAWDGMSSAAEFPDEPRSHMHRVLAAFDLDEAGRPGEAVLVDAFARAESVMPADATALARRREIDIRGRASCGDTIDVSTRICRPNDTGQNGWKLVGTARRRLGGHLLATCETSLDATT